MDLAEEMSPRHLNWLHRLLSKTAGPPRNILASEITWICNSPAPVARICISIYKSIALSYATKRIDQQRVSVHEKMGPAQQVLQ
ncbi:unnamed protein product [Linum trigynum]|uniref:Uncharacterized protein n=1 Tax=Linum trigynum TaxID=586398 RepID=A0AAV2F4Y8_9ROSI